jgi:hypothetical protein
VVSLLAVMAIAPVAPSKQRWMSESRVRERVNAALPASVPFDNMTFGKQNIAAAAPGEPVFGGLPIFVGRGQEGFEYLGSVTGPDGSPQNWSETNPPPGTLLLVDSSFGSWERGWWAATAEYDYASLRVRSMSSQAASERDRLGARAVLCEKLRTMGPYYQAWANTLEADGLRWRRSLWSGYVFNSVSLVLLALWMVALSGIPRWPQWFTGLITVRVWRYARGRCGWCGYPRSGRGDDVPCPECGQRPIDDFAIRERR